MTKRKDGDSGNKILPRDLANFITQGVSITASSRDSRFIPSISRVLACKVNDEKNQITLFLVKSQSLQLVSDIEQTRTIAAVFSLPSSHRTLQIKGIDAKKTQVTSEDIPLIEKSTHAFSDDIFSLGYSRKFSHAFHAYERDDLIAICFTLHSLFEQSPGPDAGKPLEFAS